MSLQYTRTELKNYINAGIKNKQGALISFDNIVNRAVRDVLGEVDIRSTKRIANLAPNLFNDIYDYAAPSDLKGKALIQLRKFGTSETLDFYLTGDEPAFVDMPIWYTHNIKNIGQEELLTMFWINEPYDPADPDTFFENI
jgi:hypothetical protein